MILALLLLLSEPLSLDQYRARLVRIDGLLGRGDVAAAARDASALRGVSIDANGEELEPADWVLSPLARGEPHRARLRSLIEALSAPGASAPAPDPQLLQRLAREQGGPRVAPGGEIEEIDTPAASVAEQVLRWSRRVTGFVGRSILRFLRWLAGLFPRSPGAQAEGSGQILVIVLAAVGIIVVGVAVLALLSFRRAVPHGSAPRPRTRLASDEDPLSRTAGGWEQHARELAAQGRPREAIRAWYHAVLVRCAAQGLLHHRKGRTNWEYAHALPPSVPWRGRFEDLTFRFDVEWYGRSESTGEALAAFADGAGEILKALGQRA
jgi:hypothetical protein